MCSMHLHVGIVVPWDALRRLARFSDIATKDSPVLVPCFHSLSCLVPLLLIFPIYF
jgi:hypothetical protein